jgi:hypothetical protein
VRWWWRLVDWWRGPPPCDHEWRHVDAFRLGGVVHEIVECERCGRDETLRETRRAGA